VAVRAFQWVTITLILITCFSIVEWVRAGDTFHIAHAFPFLGGHDPGRLYDIAGLILLLITINGIRRIWRRDDE